MISGIFYKRSNFLKCSTFLLDFCKLLGLVIIRQWTDDHIILRPSESFIVTIIINIVLAIEVFCFNASFCIQSVRKLISLKCMLRHFLPSGKSENGLSDGLYKSFSVHITFNG